MTNNTPYSVIITTINYPTEAMVKIAEKVTDYGFNFIVVGDEKSPQDFSLDNCSYYSIEEQIETGFTFARNCPTRHYARKNIGYLIAISKRSQFIVETDDDNIPLDDFWHDPQATISVPQLSHQGWVNVYKYFTSALIWPRGLPLDTIHDHLPKLESLKTGEVICPIQQGLADDNPDVDAIYRLILPLPLKFNTDIQIALGKGSWCPFNSQNTIWFPDAYPLLYLPAYCSFRMTDIWRSFVAQRIDWENGWSILFHSSTVYQERNEHNLMKDFQDEVVGYVNNHEIAQILDNLKLASGVNNIADNMMMCYSKLIELGVVGEKEIKLLENWFEDLSKISSY